MNLRYFLLLVVCSSVACIDAAESGSCRSCCRRPRVDQKCEYEYYEDYLKAQEQKKSEVLENQSITSSSPEESKN